MTQVEISKERLKLENEFQELLKEKNRLQRHLECVNNAISKNMNYQDLLILNVDDYKREKTFWQSLDDRVADFDSRNKKLMRLA